MIALYADEDDGGHASVFADPAAWAEVARRLGVHEDELLDLSNAFVETIGRDDRIAAEFEARCFSARELHR